MSDTPGSAVNNGGTWLGFAKDGAKLIISFGLGAATYFGTGIHPIFREHWLPIGLGCALVMAIYILVRRESARSTTVRIAGIVRAWSRREELDAGRIMEALERAQNIDMLGYNLRAPWFRRRGQFDELLRGRLSKERDFRVRILIADPDSPGLGRRASCEDGHESERMRADGNRALEYLNDLLRTHISNGLEVRLLDADLVRCCLIFGGDRLFVTHYLARRTGNTCPAFEIGATKSGLYETYRQEFEDLWNEGWAHGAP
jgi:hypothetical protein